MTLTLQPPYNKSKFETFVFNLNTKDMITYNHIYFFVN